MIDNQTYQFIEQKVVKGAFGARLAQLEGEHAALVEAQAALKVAGNELMREAAIDQAKFDGITS